VNARGWGALAAAALGVAALAAIALVAARLPGLAPLVGQDLFRRLLVVHVDFALHFWLLCAAAFLWAVERKGAVARAPAVLAGVAMLAVLAAAALPGGATVTSNYVPVVDSPAFACALAAFLCALAWAAADGLLAERACATAWSRAVLLAAPVAIALACRKLEGREGLAYYEALFWGGGHVLQFVHVLAMMRLWQLAAGAAGADTRLARGAVLFTAACALAGVAIAALPGLTPHDERRLYTLAMACGTWPGAALLFADLARRAPDRRAFLRAAAPSAAVFFAGIALGFGIRGETTGIPAHYHATVGAATLAWMGAMPAWLGGPAARASRARLVFAAGLVLLVAGLYVAGLDGAPRKTPFAGGTASSLLIGIGGATAVLAALAFSALLLLGLRASGAEGATSRRDRRWRAFAATAASIAVVGAIVAAWPHRHDERPAPQASASHARERALKEVSARFEQGAVMLHAKQYEHALTAFHRVLQLDPKLPEAHVNAGFALVGLGRHAAARDFFNGAIELRPSQLNAYYGLAVALEALGDLEGARGAMRVYVHRAPAADPYRRKAEAALWEWESRPARIASARAAR